MKTAARAGRRRYRAGVAGTEFAMVAGAFLLVFFGLIEMALAVYDYNAVCTAAREAVRYAIVHSPTSANPATKDQIQQVAENYAASLDPTQLTVTVNWPTDANLPAQKDAQVQVTYQYQMRIPFFSSVSISLTSTSQMLVSQ